MKRYNYGHGDRAFLSKIKILPGGERQCRPNMDVGTRKMVENVGNRGICLDIACRFRY
jgi:hypothetical protein